MIRDIITEKRGQRFIRRRPTCRRLVVVDGWSAFLRFRIALEDASTVNVAAALISDVASEIKTGAG